MMKKGKKGLSVILSGVAAVILLISSCSDRVVIPTQDDNLIGFKFFLFAELDGEKFQGNGDAVLIRDELFKFRVYDNLLSKHVLSFESLASGQNTALMVMDEIGFEKTDTVLSDILTHYLYLLFTETGLSAYDGENVVEAVVSEGRIDYVEFEYYGSAYRLDIMKYFDDGQPRRIAIEGDGSSLIFDITEFQDYDFPDVGETFTIYTSASDNSFFDWIGAAYGG